MAAERDLYKDLGEALEHEARHLAQLIDLLKEERKDLIEATGERIGLIAAEKMNRIQALDTYAARRTLLLEQLGFNTNADGMQAAIGCAGPLAKHMRAQWQSVGERAVAARDLNDLNGSLIRARLSNVQGRLSELHRAAQQGEGLYGADGLSRAAALSRPLGEV
jgi:flagellar biosynthesis/type III secretory pathway chaperone